VLNVSGGSSISLAGVIALVEELSGQAVPIDRRPAQSGDVHRTGGSTERVRELLGWFPTTDLRTGLRRQLDWHRGRRGATTAPAQPGR
jgi:UDP-glucuronate 4-epimerase